MYWLFSFVHRISLFLQLIFMDVYEVLDHNMLENSMDGLKTRFAIAIAQWIKFLNNETNIEYGYGSYHIISYHFISCTRFWPIIWLFAAGTNWRYRFSKYTKTMQMRANEMRASINSICSWIFGHYLCSKHCEESIQYLLHTHSHFNRDSGINLPIVRNVCIFYYVLLKRQAWLPPELKIMANSKVLEITIAEWVKIVNSSDYPLE